MRNYGVVWVLVIFMQVFLALPVAGQTTEGTAWALEFLPAHRLFPVLTADGTGHHFGIAKDIGSHLWMGSAGAQPRFVEVTVGTTKIQVSPAGTLNTSILRWASEGDIVTIDYHIEFFVDLQLTTHLTVRTGYGHFSAHFSDTWVNTTGARSVNYSKEYVPFFCAYRIAAIGGFVYGGGRFNSHAVPEETHNWVLQCGAEVGNIPLVAGIRAYASFDIKAKGEVAWGTTQSYQVGVKLFERDERCLRTAFTYRTGIDDRGQFYNDRIDLGLLGIYFDL